MEHIYEVNGLVFWTEDEIHLREHFKTSFARQIKQILHSMNKAWHLIEIEAPLFTPRELINPNYTNEDVWVQEIKDENDHELVLRPETTPGSYFYASHLIKSQGITPPFVVWQAGKSFRRERDFVIKNMRLKEFYQQEFQCIYTADTLNDYHAKCLDPVKEMIGNALALPVRVVPSDRLPSYSQVTMDIEINNGDKWMEVCSISRRTDFPGKAKFTTTKGIVEKDILVLEIAIGLDRCVYCYNQRIKATKI